MVTLNIFFGDIYSLFLNFRSLWENKRLHVNWHSVKLTPIFSKNIYQDTHHLKVHVKPDWKMVVGDSLATKIWLF